MLKNLRQLNYLFAVFARIFPNFPVRDGSVPDEQRSVAVGTRADFTRALVLGILVGVDQVYIKSEMKFKKHW